MGGRTTARPPDELLCKAAERVGAIIEGAGKVGAEVVKQWERNRLSARRREGAALTPRQPTLVSRSNRASRISAAVLGDSWTGTPVLRHAASCP